MPAGSLAKAASVGAKTVNGPGPFRIETRPAPSSAAAKVLNWPVAAAVSTTSVPVARAGALLMLAMAVATTARVASFDLMVLNSLVRCSARGPRGPRKPRRA